jgi:hypothetical protein
MSLAVVSVRDMVDLVAGGVVGLFVAIASQWFAGGRSKRLRSVIREELELVRLLDEGADEQVRAKLKVQARMHVLEYLDDPEMDGSARAWRALSFQVVYGCLCGAAVVSLVWIELPELPPWTGVLAGFVVTSLLALVAVAASSWFSTQWARRHFARGLRAEVARRERERWRRFEGATEGGQWAVTLQNPV